MVRDTTGKHPNYFEAILQLRDCTEEVFNFVEDEIAVTKLKIAKVAKVKTGLDYYLADTALTKALGKKLQTKFGGDYQVTASIFGRKDGKEIFRTTILFRQAHFKKKDIVEYKGEPYLVVYMGKDIMLQHQKTGKKVHLKYKDMNQIKPFSSA